MQRTARVQVPFEVMQAGETFTYDPDDPADARIVGLVHSGFLDDITEEGDSDDSAPEPDRGGKVTAKSLRGAGKEDPEGDAVAS